MGKSSKQKHLDTINAFKNKIKKHKVIKKLFDHYDADINDIDNIPVAFADLDVSARTDHGVILLNNKLIGSQDIAHYLVHEITHYCQQCYRAKPTNNDADYLDNKFEQESFQNQTKYIEDTKGEEKADEYLDKVLDKHEVPKKDRNKVKDKLSWIISTAGKKEDLLNKYPSLSSAIDFFSRNDPSGSLKYLDYELSILNSGKALEQEISDVIQLFHKFQNNLPNKDIYSYKNFTKLRDLLFEIKQKQEEKQKKVTNLYKIDKNELKKGAEKVYEDNTYAIWHIKNKAASVHYGLGTKWCISQKSANYFTNYDSNNVVFFFIFNKALDKNDSNYKIAQVYQRDFNNQITKIQYFNALDNIITPNISEEILNKTKNIAESVPKSIVAKVGNNEASEEEVRKVIEIWINTSDTNEKNSYKNILNKNRIFRSVRNNNDNLLKEEVGESLFRLIKENPIKAVRQNGLAIQYIENPTEEVKLTAVKQNGFTIQYIEKPTEELKLEAVRQNGYAIKYIKNPTEELKQEAVRQDGNAIRHIENPSEELKLEAVRQNGSAIQFIENPTEEVQLEAVRQNGYARQKGYAIQYIAKPTEKVKIEAVKQNGNVIRHIENPSEKVKLEAVRQNGSAIQFIENPTEEVLAEFIRR